MTTDGRQSGLWRSFTGSQASLALANGKLLKSLTGANNTSNIFTSLSEAYI